MGEADLLEIRFFCAWLLLPRRLSAEALVEVEALVEPLALPPDPLQLPVPPGDPHPLPPSGL
jgi:hypothetical protein